MGTPHFPNLQDWSLAIKYFIVISKTLVEGGVLPLWQDAVGIFYCPCRLGFIFLKDQSKSPKARIFLGRLVPIHLSEAYQYLGMRGWFYYYLGPKGLSPRQYLLSGSEFIVYYFQKGNTEAFRHFCNSHSWVLIRAWAPTIKRLH